MEIIVLRSAPMGLKDFAVLAITGLLVRDRLFDLSASYF